MPCVSNSSSIKSTSENQLTDNNEHEESEDTNSQETSSNEPPPIVKLNKPRPRTMSSSTDSTIRNSEVHSQRELCTSKGINLEILVQLRNLGEEIRNDRFKKEQKQYIKHVVNKELNKSRIRSKYVPDLIPVCESQQENETQEAPVSVPQEPQPEPPIFRSRIRR